MSTTPHLLLISSFHNVSNQLSFISSFYMFIPSASFTFSAMPTTSHHLLISSFNNVCDKVFFHLFLLHLHTISTLFPSPSRQCLPLHIYFCSLHSIMYLISSLSSLLIACSYHLNLVSLTFSAIPSQPCFPHQAHLLRNAYHSMSSGILIPLMLSFSETRRKISNV